MGVKVKGLAIRTNKDVEYRAGMTVGQALLEAKVEVPTGGTVTAYQMADRNVAGERQIPLDSLATAPVADNEVLVVTPPVSNG